MEKNLVVHRYTSRKFLSLGTLNEIITEVEADKNVIDNAIRRVGEIDDAMSAFKRDSEISKINLYAGQKWVSVSPDCFNLLKLSTNLSEVSAGAFDITIKPIVELWGINKKSNYFPEDLQIHTALKLVNYKDLLLDEKSHSARLANPGQAIDLGGIAKGYAADEVKRILLDGGIKTALINLGGNIIAVGRNHENMPWKIGIQNPMAVRGTYVGVLSAENVSVVTSGSNERFFVKNGVRCHHIINPKTGIPAQSGLLSATIVAENSTLADALSTAAFVLGMEKGLDLIKKYGAEAIFATDDFKVYVTDGLKDKFVMCEKEASLERGCI